jgi:hypothetical protein
MITLYEELYLLTLDEEKGNIIWFARKSFAYSIVGLVLAELALLKKLGVAEKQRLVAVDPEPTGDPILDDVLKQIHDSEKLHKPAYWVALLSREPKKLRQSIGEQLVEKKVLTQEEKRFYRQEVPSTDAPEAGDKFQFKYELRSLILSNSEFNPRNLALLKMIAASDLLSLVFTQDEIESAERIINKQLLNAALGDQTMQLVEEIGQAVTSILEEEME